MKNNEKLNEAIGNIDDSMINAAYKRSSAKGRRSGLFEIIGSAAAVIAIAIFAVVLSRFATKTVNPSASSGTDTAKEQLLYDKDFTDHYEHNIKFTSDDGTLDYELKLILPVDERFFFKCYAKVTNKTDSSIELHKAADHNSFFYLENILKNAEYEQTFVYDGNAKEDTVTLKPGGSYEELLTYKDGVKAYMKSDYVQHEHDVSGYLTVTVNLDPSMSRTWGKSFTWFEGSYLKNNGSAADIVFMTPEELADVSKIHVTSLPEGYDYSFSGEEVKPITDYLVSLHPVSIDDNDGYMDGMTWVIELTYADGTVKEIYHIGNTYIHKSDGNKKYYKLTYEEASRFGSIIRDYEDETTAIPDNDSITENFIEILKRDGYYYYYVNEKQHKMSYNTENAIFNNITPDDWKQKLPGVYLFSSPTYYFIMVNDVIYVPFNTTGGILMSIEPNDYNNDGVMDIKASFTWGSGIGHFSVKVFDLQKMETVSLESYLDYFTTPYLTNLPEDFSFSIVWDCYGISSYDSKTGKLIKTKDTTNISKYTTTYKMSKEELSRIYNILFSRIDINSYPDEYDPYNAPDAEIRLVSKPSQTVIISVTANGHTKTVTCNDISFGSEGYDDKATAFLKAKKDIVDILTNTDEWQALPDYEFLYD